MKSFRSRKSAHQTHTTTKHKRSRSDKPESSLQTASTISIHRHSPLLSSTHSKSKSTSSAFNYNISMSNTDTYNNGADHEEQQEPPPMQLSSSASLTDQPSESATPSILSTSTHHSVTSIPSPHRRHTSLSQKPSDQNLRNMLHRSPAFKWSISGPTLAAMKKSKHEQGYESNTFKLANNPHKTIKEIVWKLECFANGYFGDDLGQCKLFLTSVTLPPNVNKVVACITLYCRESQIRYVGTDQFTYNSCQCGWSDDTMAFSRLKKLQTLTFECWIDVLQIHYENDERTGGKAKESKVKLYNYLTFEWKINKALLNEFRTADVGQGFCSAVNGHFWLQLMPNGYIMDTRGKMKLYLESVGILPSGLRSIKLKYKIICKEMEFEKEDTVKIKKKSGYSAIANFNFGKLRAIKKLKQLTFRCMISIENAYDSKKNPINKKYWNKHGILPMHFDMTQFADTSSDEQMDTQHDTKDDENERMSENNNNNTANQAKSEEQHDTITPRQSTESPQESHREQMVSTPSPTDELEEAQKIQIAKSAQDEQLVNVHNDEEEEGSISYQNKKAHDEDPGHEQQVHEEEEEEEQVEDEYLDEENQPSPTQETEFESASSSKPEGSVRVHDDDDILDILNADGSPIAHEMTDEDEKVHKQAQNMEAMLQEAMADINGNMHKADNALLREEQKNRNGNVEHHEEEDQEDEKQDHMDEALPPPIPFRMVQQRDSIGSTSSHRIDDRDNDDLHDEQEEITSINTVSSNSMSMHNKSRASDELSQVMVQRATNTQLKEEDANSNQSMLHETKTNDTEIKNESVGSQQETKEEPQQHADNDDEHGQNGHTEAPPEKKSKFKVTAFSELSSNLSNINDDGIDEEDDDEHHMTNHLLSFDHVNDDEHNDNDHFIQLDDDARRDTVEFDADSNPKNQDTKTNDDDDDDGDKQNDDNDHDTKEEEKEMHIQLNGTTVTQQKKHVQAVGRFVIEPAKSKSFSNLEEPSPTAELSISPNALNTLPHREISDHVEADEERDTIQPLLHPNLSFTPSNRNNNNDASPNNRGFIGRFLVSAGGKSVSVDSVATYDEFNEKVDIIHQKLDEEVEQFKSMQISVNEMKLTQQAQTAKYMQQLEELNTNIKRLSECVEHIKVTQQTILNKIQCDEMQEEKQKELNVSENALKMWLCDNLKMAQYYDVFVKEGFDDVAMLCYLDENDLIKLGVNKMAHRKKLMMGIKILQKSFVAKETYYVFEHPQPHRNGTNVAAEDEEEEDEEEEYYDNDTHGGHHNDETFVD